MAQHERYAGAATVMEWYTPPAVFEALGLNFDLDPCAPVGGVPWVPAAKHFHRAQDGLCQPWEGRVWLNPPYGPETGAWLRRLAAHGDGIGLVFARTDTAWFHDVVPQAHAVCFMAGRLTFVAADGTQPPTNAGAPSMLIAFGAECAAAVAGAGLGLTFAVTDPTVTGQATLWDTVPA